MRKLIFIALMVMSVCGYAQKYEVGTTTAVWKAPAAADFLHAKAIGVKYVEVAFNQCYRGVPVDEVIPRIKEMKAKTVRILKSGLFIFLSPERWISQFWMIG